MLYSTQIRRKTFWDIKHVVDYSNYLNGVNCPNNCGFRQRFKEQYKVFWSVCQLPPSFLIL